jgi:homopolymeric O-antigen transport system permease protein
MRTEPLIDETMALDGDDGVASDAVAAGESSAKSRPLVAAPTVVIEAGRRRIPLDLGELWAHRDLLYFLAWRDIKLRYKQTVLGAAWAVLQPFLTMVVFTVLFGRLARMPSDGLPYPIFVYAGLLPWTFFNTAVTNSSNSLVGNSALITKVYFPRLVIPGAAVAAGLLDFAISGVMLAAMMVYYHVGATWNLLMIPPLVVLTALVALTVGLWMSALNVKYRDVRYALPFTLQILLYLTPVIYPVKFIPEQYRWALSLNPLTGVVEGFRSALFAHPFGWERLAIATAMTLLMLLYAVYSFRQMEREFADVI